MRRTVLVPTMVAAASRARRMLVAMSLAVLLALALVLAAPVAAQEETTSQEQTVTGDKNASGKREQAVQGSGQEAEENDEQAAARATDSLQGAPATIESSADKVDRIVIAAADCDVEKGATVTVTDESGGDAATFVNLGDASRGTDTVATISPAQNEIVIDDFTLEDRDFGSAEGSKRGTVTDFSGITCGRDDDGDANAGDDTRTADELLDLGCDELLVLFRAESSSGQQYEDAAVFADSDVRAQVEVCLEEEIIEGTAADEDLPDTGGLSLLALVVLGAVSAAAGLFVIRGGRR